MGTGEVTATWPLRVSTVAKGVLVSPIPPYLLQAATTPTGYRKACSTGSPRPPGPTPGLDEGIPGHFYNIDTLRGTLVSDQAFQASWNLAVTASATAAVACIAPGPPTSATTCQDRRAHAGHPGDADQVLRWTRRQAPAGLIKDMHLVVVEGAPRHRLTHADQSTPPARLPAHLNPGHPRPAPRGHGTAGPRNHHQRSHYV